MTARFTARAAFALCLATGLAAVAMPVASAAAPTAKSTAKTPKKYAVPSKRPPDRERGRELWLQSCWQCHGEEGKGDGPAATALPDGVPTLESKVSQAQFDALVKVIQDGKGRMPAYKEDIDKHDARRILIYLQDALQGRTEAQKDKDDKDEDGDKEN
ncbi:hypothetical protein LBMAG42_01280 [Deltaproteobacteria bacterium]|nr:hypothetical protein LBMAG42_01280 [Deltaproteobacteria bacterium]